jgi:nitrate reductase cytochrome c-type subunit
MQRLRLIPWLILAAACSAPQAGAPPVTEPAPAAVADSALGFAKGSVFEVPTPPGFEYADESGKRLPRAYPGAPPRPAHEVQSSLPITRTENECMECHGDSAGGPKDPPLLPQSHFRDMRNAPGVLRTEVAGARWVCTACHVPHADVVSPVANTF